MQRNSLFPDRRGTLKTQKQPYFHNPPEESGVTQPFPLQMAILQKDRDLRLLFSYLFTRVGTWGTLKTQKATLFPQPSRGFWSNPTLPLANGNPPKRQRFTTFVLLFVYTGWHVTARVQPCETSKKERDFHVGPEGSDSSPDTYTM
ncbi:hypothetical protein CDAR_240271 [Caerostris darwini]|uniref:Uncharacterized protein n=1 Tax=Caerostris darwini TaxID=1538125 RepID=A0AAV4QE97_9ARAC|nr:hypothetical protein CDAR_240271 [Caerostris darwini]